MASEKEARPARISSSKDRVIRIVSDLHLGHPGSTIKSASQFFRVVAGADHVVFNGDTIEEYANRFRPWSDKLWADLVSHMDAHGITFENLTGNHDPTLFKAHRLDLLEGAVLVTHGDFLFKYVSPWSGKADKTKHTLDKIIANAPPGYVDDLDARLDLTRELCKTMVAYQRQGPQGLKGRLLTLWRAFWPPTRPFRILQTWFASPKLASKGFAHYSPDAQFLIIGHTHRAFIQKSSNGQIVINTGAFYALSKPLVVDIHPANRELRVFKIIRGNDGFEIGPELGRYRVAAAVGGTGKRSDQTR